MKKKMRVIVDLVLTDAWKGGEYAEGDFVVEIKQAITQSRMFWNADSHEYKITVDSVVTRPSRRRKGKP